jgi:hypothetical protein
MESNKEHLGSMDHKQFQWDDWNRGSDKTPKVYGLVRSYRTGIAKALALDLVAALFSTKIENVFGHLRVKNQ